MAALSTGGDRILRFGLCTVNLTRRQLTTSDAVQDLDAKEYDVLALLLERRGQVVTYEEFRNTIWAGAHLEIEPALHARVSRLKRALGNSHYIENRRGQGYRFNPAVAIVDSAPAQPSAALTKPGWRHWAAAAVVCTLLLAAAVAANRYKPAPVRVADSSRLAGRDLQVFDQYNSPLWHYEFPTGASTHIYDPLNIAIAPRFIDLDGDGRKEVLFPLFDPVNGDVPSILYCFNPDGSVRWKRAIGREIRTTRTGLVYPAIYSFRWMTVLNHTTPHGGVVVIGGNRGGTSLFCVELLDRQGKVVGQYYHPGWLFSVKAVDLDGDGIDEIVLGGVNNAYSKEPGFRMNMTLVVLDSRSIEGEGPAPAADHRHFEGLTSGREKAVLLFPEFGDRRSAKPSSFCVIDHILVVGHQLDVRARRIDDPDYAVDYTLDFDLAVLKLQPSAEVIGTLKLPLGASNQVLNELFMRELGGVRVLKNVLAGAGSRVAAR